MASAAGVQASEGDVTDGFFFAQQTPAGWNAKNPDGTSRCNAAGRSLGTTRAGDGPAGGLAKDTERHCLVVCVRRDFKVVFGERMGKRGGITFHRFTTRAIGQRAQRDGGMPCAVRFSRHYAAG